MDVLHTPPVDARQVARDLLFLRFRSWEDGYFNWGALRAAMSECMRAHAHAHVHTRALHGRPWLAPPPRACMRARILKYMTMTAR